MHEKWKWEYYFSQNPDQEALKGIPGYLAALQGMHTFDFTSPAARNFKNGWDRCRQQMLKKFIKDLKNQK